MFYIYLYYDSMQPDIQRYKSYIKYSIPNISSTLYPSKPNILMKFYKSNRFISSMVYIFTSSRIYILLSIKLMCT